VIHFIAHNEVFQMQDLSMMRRRRASCLLGVRGFQMQGLNDEQKKSKLSVFK
jgi:hypothetical protein